MSYSVLREKYPRLADKIEAIQTLANMGLADIDYVRLDEMEKNFKPSNNFIRKSEKWLQQIIEQALNKTDFNIVFSNLNLSQSDVCDTNKFTYLVSSTKVLQLAKTIFAATVNEPQNVAKMYNARLYNGFSIRAYTINNSTNKNIFDFFFWTS